MYCTVLPCTAPLSLWSLPPATTAALPSLPLPSPPQLLTIQLIGQPAAAIGQYRAQGSTPGQRQVQRRQPEEPSDVQRQRLHAEQRCGPARDACGGGRTGGRQRTGSKGGEHGRGGGQVLRSNLGCLRGSGPCGVSAGGKQRGGRTGEGTHGRRLYDEQCCSSTQWMHEYACREPVAMNIRICMHASRSPDSGGWVDPEKWVP